MQKQITINEIKNNITQSRELAVKSLMNSGNANMDQENMGGYRILAEGCYAPNDDIRSGFNNNDLIIGGSGSGKTGGYVIPNIRGGFGSMIVADTKSRLYRMLGKEMERKGYRVQVLDFVNPENSCVYNPLDYIRENKSDYSADRYSNKDIVSLARALVPTTTSDDAFWQDSARTVMTFLLAFTMEALVPEEHTMMSLVELYRMLGTEKGRKTFEMWCEEHPKSFAAKKYAMFSGLLPADRTWACVMQFVTEAIDLFDFEEIRTMFNRTENKIDIRKIGYEKTILFLNVSDTNRYVDRLVNLFYTQAMQVMCEEADKMENGRLPVPVRFILDDFAANIYIENFDRIISVIRSRNISASIILQSLTQLHSMYSPEQAGTIISNCDHMLYLGGQDITTAQYIGLRANRTEDKIMTMPLEKAYFIERGKMAVMADKITPYAKENEEDNWMELDLSDEDIFLDHFLDEETKKTSD